MKTDIMDLCNLIYAVSKGRASYSNVEAKVYEIKKTNPKFANYVVKSSDEGSNFDTPTGAVVHFWNSQDDETFCKMLELMIENGGDVLNDYNAVISKHPVRTSVWLYAKNNNNTAALDCMKSLGKSFGGGTRKRKNLKRRHTRSKTRK